MAARAPRRSSTAFVATVVPWMTSDTRAGWSPTSSRMASTTATSYRGGVDSTFLTRTSPDSDWTMTSVKVPPTSAPIRAFRSGASVAIRTTRDGHQLSRRDEHLVEPRATYLLVTLSVERRPPVLL